MPTAAKETDEAPRTIAGQTAAWRIARLVAERSAAAMAAGLPPPKHGAHAAQIGVSVRTLRRALRWTATQDPIDPDAERDHCRVMLDRLQASAETLHQTIQRRANDDRRGCLNELTGAIKAEIALADAIRSYVAAAGQHAGTVTEYALLQRRRARAQEDAMTASIAETDPPAMWPDLEADRHRHHRRRQIDSILAFDPPVRLTLLAAALDALSRDAGEHSAYLAGEHLETDRAIELEDVRDADPDAEYLIEQLSVSWLSDAAMMAEVMPSDADLETADLRALAAAVRRQVGIEDAGDG